MRASHHPAGAQSPGRLWVDGDYQAYLQFLREQADKDDLHVVGSCLMGNDVHLVAIPRGENALAKAVGRTHFRYAR